ncbi:DUF2812 domain-containing protein [Fusibacter sp. 3D3]|uniref:DUF2812 domain-containing protein n=1 Tax=Fusibacter sp. 3D3 TaxID=1048380 RepID=UPI0008531501|nr:DUF2812 domain-containing protein [Fusibacter sp. 3D3]GAU77916.1 hypothetical protein F3D3_2545 [Fusibacter sp. 3D3]
MNNYKTQFFLWWGWNCEPFENHLESMASKGWILERSMLGHTRLFFKRAEPSKIRYCVDYQNDINLSGEYRHIMEDDQWQLINKLSGWYLWQKSYETQRPSIFTDKQSLIERNNRLLKFAIIIASAQIPLAIIVLSNAMQWAHQIGFLVYCFYGLFFGLMGYSIYSLIKQNRILKG